MESSVSISELYLSERALPREPKLARAELAFGSRRKKAWEAAPATHRQGPKR